jgi:nitrogen fixation NifU-like protein
MDGLDDLYKEIILDHYRSPRNRGELVAPPACRAEGFNPLCGDQVTVYVQCDGDVIADIKISGSGCSISQASASLMSAAVKGQTIASAYEKLAVFKRLMTIDDTPGEPINIRSLGEMAALQGVVQFPARIKCAILAWNTLDQALSSPSA